MKKFAYNFVGFGMFFGFPKCCIRAFITGFGKEDFGGRKLNGTGYIPCLECNKKTPEELINTIRTNRTCPDPFPEAQMKLEKYKAYFELRGDNK